MQAYIDLPSITDEKRGGYIVALEAMKNVPFAIKRVYFIHCQEAQCEARGFHAHKALNQVAICLQGQCRIVLDDGFQQKEILLHKTTQAVLIPNMVWHELHDFAENSLILLLASDYYDESDYIRNYDEFLSATREYV